MRCKSNSCIPIIKDDKLRFEHDISKNLDGSALVPLHGAEAHLQGRIVSQFSLRDLEVFTVVAHVCKVHQIAGESSYVRRSQC